MRIRNRVHQHDAHVYMRASSDVSAEQSGSHGGRDYVVVNHNNEYRSLDKEMKRFVQQSPRFGWRPTWRRGPQQCLVMRPCCPQGSWECGDSAISRRGVGDTHASCNGKRAMYKQYASLTTLDEDHGQVGRVASNGSEPYKFGHTKLGPIRTSKKNSGAIAKYIYSTL